MGPDRNDHRTIHLAESDPAFANPVDLVVGHGAADGVVTKSRCPQRASRQDAAVSVQLFNQFHALTMAASAVGGRCEEAGVVDSSTGGRFLGRQF